MGRVILFVIPIVEHSREHDLLIVPGGLVGVVRQDVEGLQRLPKPITELVRNHVESLGPSEGIRLKHGE